MMRCLQLGLLLVEPLVSSHVFLKFLRGDSEILLYGLLKFLHLLSTCFYARKMARDFTKNVNHIVQRSLPSLSLLLRLTLVIPWSRYIFSLFLFYIYILNKHLIFFAEGGKPYLKILVSGKNNSLLGFGQHM